MRRVMMVSLAVVVSLLTASCGGNDDSGALSEGKTVVDASTGVIETPLDDYLPTESQQRLFTYALEIKAAECAASQGVTYTPIKPSDVVTTSEYGVWQMSQATHYGYGAAMTSLDEAVLRRDRAMSETDHQVVADCMLEPEMNSVKYPASSLAAMPFLRELSALRPIDTEQGAKIVNEWRSCLKDAGITPPGEPRKLQEYDWIPPEVGGMQPEAQFQTAVADVTCKDQVHLVQRETEIQAGMEQKVIDEHMMELAAFREVWTSRLDNAQEVIDGYHGG